MIICIITRNKEKNLNKRIQMWFQLLKEIWVKVSVKTHTAQNLIIHSQVNYKKNSLNHTA